MFEMIRFHWKLRRLHRAQDENSIEHHAAIKALRGRKATRDDLDSTHAGYAHEDDIIEYEIRSISTRYYTRVARRLLVSVPSMGDSKYWIEDDTFGGHLLNAAGIKLVRERIREEVNARWEFALKWATLSIGVIGALTGFMAVLLAKQ